MGERLVIRSIDKSKITQVTRVLAQLPNLTAGVIHNLLQALPWTLPEIPDHRNMKNVQYNLRQLGCRVDVEYYESGPGTVLRRPKPESAKSKAFKETVPRPVEPNKPKSIPEKKKTMHREEISLSASRKPKPASKISGNRKMRQALILLAIVALGAGLTWIGTLLKKENAPAEQSQVNQQKQMKMPGSPSLSKSRSAEVDKELRGNHVYVQKKSLAKKAGQYFKRAQEETLPRMKSQYLTQTLQHNPYHLEAWRELIRIKENQGLQDEAQQLKQESYRQNEKVRKVLRSIAGKFGKVRRPLELSPSDLDFYIKVTGTGKENMMEKSFKFYHQVEKLHGDKKLSATFYHDREGLFQMEVPPGKGALTRKQFSRYFWKE